VSAAPNYRPVKWACGRRSITICIPTRSRNGLTGTPEASGIYEAGIAIPDIVCDGTSAGQEVVRTLAHEIVHYLLNHEDVSEDHVANSHNRMLSSNNDTKRDLNQSQCIELRTNYGVD